MPKSAALTAELLEQLVAAAGNALRNNAEFGVTDRANRTWFVAPEVDGNHSVVMVRLTRGQETRVRNLSTATLLPDVASAAIQALDGEL